MKIAINGFGRIGRQALKIALSKDIEVAAVNDLTRADELAHLLKFDSVYGTYDKEVKAIINGREFVAGTNSLLDISKEELAEADSKLIVDGREVKVFAKKDPAELPWGELGVDIALECTGIFVKDDSARGHITAGAKHVIISAPSKGDNPAPTYVIGVNEGNFAKEEIISNASCTTNSLTPVAKLMHDHFGILKAGMTTIHAVTASQNLVDGLHSDLREGRSAMQNTIPTTTGAAISTTQVIPELKGLFDGLSVRVPVICGSLTDFTFLVSRTVSVDEVNNVFRDAANSEQYRGILEVSEAPLVSSDVIGRTASAIVDLPLTKVIAGDLVKVMAWYDNEWGYSNRLVELAMKVIK